MEAEKARQRIRLLIPRTTARGASEAEQDSAAREIGVLLMRFPELIDSGSLGAAAEDTSTADEIETVWLEHHGIVRETERAVLLRFTGRNVWLPKSQLRAHTAHRVQVSRWLAEGENLL